MNVMKKLMLLSAVIVLMLAFLPGNLIASAAAQPDVTFVKVNGTKVAFPDGQPMIKNGSTLVPVRFIAEALKYTVDWDNITKTVIIDGGNIMLPIGSKTATVAGVEKSVSMPAQLIKVGKETRTYVPLRFVSENLNCTVDWWSFNRSIVINAFNQDGTEVNIYDRCRQSENFYEYKYMYDFGDFGNGPVKQEDPYLILNSRMTYQKLTADKALLANWKICKDRNGNDKGFYYDPGHDSCIVLKDPDLESRQEIKEVLRVFYPTGYETIYNYMKQAILNTIFEYDNERMLNVTGTFGLHYVDGREVDVMSSTNSNTTVIRIKRFGYISDELPLHLEWNKENYTSLVAGGRSQNDALSRWYRNQYGLDEW